MNPFDNDNGVFYVLVNDEEQHSIWPTFAHVPEGWSVVFEGNRTDALQYVEEHWLDMRPKTLRMQLESELEPSDLEPSESEKQVA